MKKKDLKKIASSKEINSLKFIKQECDVKFKGKSHTDLKHFIKEWLPKAIQMKEFHKAINSSETQIAKIDNDEYGDFDGNDDFDYEYNYE